MFAKLLLIISQVVAHTTRQYKREARDLVGKFRNMGLHAANLIAERVEVLCNHIGV